MLGSKYHLQKKSSGPLKTLFRFNEFTFISLHSDNTLKLKDFGGIEKIAFLFFRPSSDLNDFRQK